jgi:hypothetical protein
MESYLVGTLQEERDRTLEMVRAYRDEIETLPKGSLVVQRIGRNEYCYLKHREGDKIASKYMGKADIHKRDLESQISRRKTLEQAIRQAEMDLKTIKRVVKT